MANNLNLKNEYIIQVVYPLPDKQYIFEVDFSDERNKTRLLNNQITIEEVINKSGILDYYSEIDFNINKVGIYSNIKQLSDFVKQFDRIEIYRPLIIDPMEARRIRAQKQKKKKQ